MSHLKVTLKNLPIVRGKKETLRMGGNGLEEGLSVLWAESKRAMIVG